MPYDRPELRKYIDDAWIGDDWALLQYLPARLGHNEAQRLILGFKDNEPEAVEFVVDLFAGVLLKREWLFRNERRARYIVAIPGSGVGTARAAAETMCARLSERIEWLDHVPGALERTHAVQKSSTATHGTRPDYATHRRTICYAGTLHDVGPDSVLMFDDVITMKATSGACRTILRQATGADRVYGIYLSRTRSSQEWTNHWS